MQFSSFSSSAGLYLLNVAVASVVLSLAAVATGLIVRRRELPLRHGLLSVALSLILLSPLAIWIATVQGFGIIPISLGKAAVAEAVPSVEPPVAFEPMPLVKSDESDVATFPEQAETIVQNTTPPMSPAADPKTAESKNATSRFASVGAIGIALVLLWATVALWYMARLVRGMFIMGRLGRSLQLSTDDRINTAMQVLSAAETNAATPVYESSLAPAPLTFGWWRPVIVMPIGLAKSLSNEELACVLAHEAAHARRHDTVIALLQQLARIGFWWNPLLHCVNRQISQLREKICDDHVVKQFGDGLPLAQAILKVARWSDTRGTGLPMVTALLDDGDNIEDRITRLAEKDRVMSVGLNRRSATLLGLFGSMLAIVLLVPVVRAQVDGSDATAKAQPRKAAEAKSVIAEPPPFPITVTGRAIDKKGNAIAGAKIYLTSPRISHKLLATTETDRDGAYRFEKIPLPIKPADTNKGRDKGSFEVYGEADGYGFAWHMLKSFYPDSEHEEEEEPQFVGQPKRTVPVRYGRKDLIKLDLIFENAGRLRGRIINNEGKPIANARLAIRDCNPLTSPDFFASLNGTTIIPARIKSRRTDDQGRFEFDSLPVNCRFEIDVRPPGYPSRRISAATREGVSLDMYGRPVYSGDFDVVFDIPRKIRIRVVYGDTGKPAPKVGVGGKVDEIGFWETTDENGVVETPIPDGNYQLGLMPRIGTPYWRTRFEHVVSAETAQEITTVTLPAAAVLDITVRDADTGAPLEGVDLWSDHSYPGGLTSKRVHHYRSWEVETRISHSDSPRSDKNGKIRALFAPVKQHIGVAMEAFPEGYKAVLPNGMEINCKPGKPILVEFRLRKTALAANKTPAQAAEPNAHKVRIRTIDQQGKPITNSEIGPRFDGQTGDVWKETDENGVFTSTISSETPRFYRIYARAKGYAPMHAYWGNHENKNDPVPAEITLKMTKAMTIGGIVVDEDNQPVEGATVSVTAKKDGNSPRINVPQMLFNHEEFTTDAQGKWLCDYAPVTMKDAFLTANHPDFAVEEWRHTRHSDTLIAELRDLTHSRTIVKGIVVTGRVVDLFGNPVEGAKLAIGQSLYSHESPIQETDSDGRYRFEHARPPIEHSSPDGRRVGHGPNHFTITVMKPGLAPQHKSIPGYRYSPFKESPPKKQTINFTLSKGGMLTLKAIDSKGRPIAGVHVRANAWNGALRVLDQSSIPRVTDKDGIWRWTDVPPFEKLYYDVQKPGSPAIRQVITVKRDPFKKTIVVTEL